MNIFEILCVFVGLIYFIMIIAFFVGFNKIEEANINNKIKVPQSINKISVIIPVRNEEENIENLIINLSNQTLNGKLFEVIIIDDFSEDNTFNKANSAITSASNIRIVKLKSNGGKKQAISQGINIATGNIIVTTDADCYHPASWLKEIYYFFKHNNCKMLIGPVKMEGTNILGTLQSIDFLSLAASTAGACGISKPIMCNGANLAYLKNVYLDFNNALNDEYTSGDDIFLLHNIKKKYLNNIFFLKSKKAIVTTYAEKNIKSFFQQRLRWASKSTAYTDIDSIVVSIIVLTTNVLIVFGILYSVYNTTYLLLTSILFAGKLIADFILLNNAAILFGLKKQMLYFPLQSLIYPFYIVIIGISSLFVKNMKWKNRKV